MYEGGGTRSAPYTFPLQAPSGALLLDAEVRPEDLVNARAASLRALSMLNVIVSFAMALLIPVVEAMPDFRSVCRRTRAGVKRDL